jgi:integrase
MFTLRSFFNWCVKENLCRRNPVLDVQLDRIDRKGRTRFADFEVAQHLIKNAPNDDLRYVLFCGFHAGMRKLEIVEAVPEWFNLSARTVEIRATAPFRPKDRDARTVPLTDQFAEFLMQWGLRSPYVLQPDVVQGSHRYRFDFRRAFSDYMNAQGSTVDYTARHAAFVRVNLREQWNRHLQNCDLARRRCARRAEALCEIAARRSRDHEGFSCVITPPSHAEALHPL